MGWVWEGLALVADEAFRGSGEWMPGLCVPLLKMPGYRISPTSPRTLRLCSILWKTGGAYTGSFLGLVSGRREKVFEVCLIPGAANN